MPIIAETWVLVGNEDEARKYAALWRFIPKALEAYTDDPDPRAIQRRAEQEVPLEQVYSGWIIGEDPKVHIEGIRKLIDNGVTTVIVKIGAGRPGERNRFLWQASAARA